MAAPVFLKMCKHFSKVFDESGLFVRQVRVKSDKGVVLLRKEVVEHPFGVLKRAMDTVTFVERV
jgi:hypothetical protein